MTQTREQQIDDLMGTFHGWTREQVAEHLDEREREYQRGTGSRQARSMCIAKIRAKAAEFPDIAPGQALTALADELEKDGDPREAHIDGVYGAYLEGYRTALTGAHFMPALGVFARTAAALGAIDGSADPRPPLRTRAALFEAVVALLQRRE